MNILKIIIKMLLNLLTGIFKFVGIPLIFIFIVIFVTFLYWVIKYLRSGKMPKFDEKIPQIKEDSIFTKLFVQFPKMLAYDTLNRDPFEFSPYGIQIVAGEQGSGKTITAIYLINKWRKRYPKMEVYDNNVLSDEYVNGRLDCALDLMIHNNGIYGIVNFLDETQNWFGSSDSRNIPPSVLSEICQQRKQRKVTLGTTQVFGKLAKPLREQTLKVYVPRTFFGCITFVRCYNPRSYNMDTDTFKKGTGDFFFFVHTKELRESYDTYKKIEVYKTSDFAPALSEGISSGNSSDNGA